MYRMYERKMSFFIGIVLSAHYKDTTDIRVPYKTTHEKCERKHSPTNTIQKIGTIFRRYVNIII